MNTVDCVIHLPKLNQHWTEPCIHDPMPVANIITNRGHGAVFQCFQANRSRSRSKTNETPPPKIAKAATAGAIYFISVAPPPPLQQRSQKRGRRIYAHDKSLSGHPQSRVLAGKTTIRMTRNNPQARSDYTSDCLSSTISTLRPTGSARWANYAVLCVCWFGGGKFRE